MFKLSGTKMFTNRGLSEVAMTIPDNTKVFLCTLKRKFILVLLTKPQIGSVREYRTNGWFIEKQFIFNRDSVTLV